MVLSSTFMVRALHSSFTHSQTYSYTSGCLLPCEVMRGLSDLPTLTSWEMFKTRKNQKTCGGSISVICHGSVYLFLSIYWYYYYYNYLSHWWVLIYKYWWLTFSYNIVALAVKMILAYDGEGTLHRYPWVLLRPGSVQSEIVHVTNPDHPTGLGRRGRTEGTAGHVWPEGRRRSQGIPRPPRTHRTAGEWVRPALTYRQAALANASLVL